MVLTPATMKYTYLLQDRRIDVALVTKTHWTSRSNFPIRNYKTHMTDHPLSYSWDWTVRKSLTLYLIPSKNSDSIQYTTIHLSSSLFNFSVSAVYCPPSKNISQQQFHTYIRFLDPIFLSGGDYITKHQQWSCRITNPSPCAYLLSLVLHIFCWSNILAYCPEQTARFPSLSPHNCPLSTIMCTY